MYFQETRQKLDFDIAFHIASDNKCFKGNSINKDALEKVFHNVMVINPDGQSTKRTCALNVK